MKYAGTPPRAKTERRLKMQELMALPNWMKLASDGISLIHPTKGITGRVRQLWKRMPLARQLAAVRKLSANDASPLDPEKMRIQSAVRRFTNWQRNQWARAGYPMDAKSLKHFGGLQRPVYGKRRAS